MRPGVGGSAHDFRVAIRSYDAGTILGIRFEARHLAHCTLG